MPGSDSEREKPEWEQELEDELREQEEADQDMDGLEQEADHLEELARVVDEAQDIIEDKQMELSQKMLEFKTQCEHERDEAIAKFKEGEDSRFEEQHAKIELAEMKARQVEKAKQKEIDALKEVIDQLEKEKALAEK